MSDKTGSLWGCERIYYTPPGPGEPGGPGGPVEHIFTGVLGPSYTVPVIVSVNEVAVNGEGQTLPNLKVGPVANTNTFPPETLDANSEINYIDFCNELQTKALELATNLGNLHAAQGGGGAPGGGGASAGVSDGVGNSCQEDFEIKANTFTINCNALIVDQCGTPPPVTINSGEVSITTDGSDVTVTNGTVTLTMSGGTINVTGGSLQVNGSNVATEAYADAAAAAAQTAAEAYADSVAATLPSHRHTYGIPGDGNTYNTGYTGS